MKYILHMLTNPIAMVSVAIVLVIVGVGILPSTFVDSIRIFFGSKEQASITASPTLVTGIKSLGQLVSIETQLAKAGIEVFIERGIVNICRFNAKHVAQGTLQAGIDLTSITEENITFDPLGDVYYITLPPARLTSCSLDPVQTQQYSNAGSSPLCPIDWDEVRRLASYVALNEFRDDAVRGGLLERAEQQAASVLANFVKAVNGKNVVIEFNDEETMTFPQSCSPEPPGRWYFDEELGRWLE